MNQIFTEIIAKIKDIPLYEAILFLLYFSFINVNLKMYSFDHLRMYNFDHIDTCCSRW